MTSSPFARPRGTTDKRRTTTTNSSSSHHHDSAPFRPHPLICTGAEPIHPVHGPPKLPAWPWPPEMRSFSCHFGRVFYAFPFPHRFSAPSLTLLAQYLLPVPTKIKVEIIRLIIVTIMILWVYPKLCSLSPVLGISCSQLR